MTLRAILVDLGGTLVDYFGHTTPGLVLPRSLTLAGQLLVSEGIKVPPLAVLEARWVRNARSPDDLEVRPLEVRLRHTFEVDESDADLLPALCRSFMTPLFAQARTYEDTLPFLDALRNLGIRAVIVSNTTWGSPAELWREQLSREGIGSRINGAVFCRDTGWRKPDPRIYAQALKVAVAGPDECLFIGDNPVWDVEGPGRAGIRGVLLDRRMEFAGQGFDRVTCLNEVTDRLQL